MYRSAARLERELKMPVTRLQSGPLGSELQIGAKTTEGAVKFMISSPLVDEEHDRILPDDDAYRRRALPSTGVKSLRRRPRNQPCIESASVFNESAIGPAVAARALPARSGVHYGLYSPTPPTDDARRGIEGSRDRMTPSDHPNKRCQSRSVASRG